METSSVFDPQSPLARAAANLFDVVLIVCAVVLLVVTALLVYCLVRFRGAPGDAEPAQVRGNRTLEIGWTIVPLLILIFLFALTLRAMNLADPPRASTAPDLVVIGHQFWWEVRYPAARVITADEIHIPTGRRWLVQVQTADVIHSFWLPQLGGKMDVIPDRANTLWLQCDRPGQFEGTCAEFCGTQHAWMRLLLVAQPPAEFDAWLRDQAQAPPIALTAAERRGAELFQKLTCVNCHSLDPTATNALAGPNLGHLTTRRVLGSGVLANTPDNLRRWLANPQQVKPGNLMPDMHLTEQQVSDLVSYFEGQP